MLISIATASLYHIPFKKALSVIRRAGYEYVELGGYWKGGDWEIAQHLKGIPPKDVLQMIGDSGLQIASYHDLGGIISKDQPTFVAPQTYEYLELYDFPCIALHTPHYKTNDASWWASFQPKAIGELRALARGRLVCIENMTRYEDYIVPLLSPTELLAFTEEANIFVNFNMTHCAAEGDDIVEAAGTLANRIKAVHLSDYGSNDEKHLFPGEGRLDISGFFRVLDMRTLHAVTVECSSAGIADETLLIERYTVARMYAEALIRQ